MNISVITNSREKTSLTWTAHIQMLREFSKTGEKNFRAKWKRRHRTFLVQGSESAIAEKAKTRGRSSDDLGFEEIPSRITENTQKQHFSNFSAKQS